ncbi:hypothetical protein ABZ038_13070 [Streptomyces sp. NPDC006349]|uniref:hypothetical protein n=1 Tax=Streptomyces sp. NPDC006349 TaxID=3156757 RepID=UPI0033BB580F
MNASLPLPVTVGQQYLCMRLETLREWARTERTHFEAAEGGGGAGPQLSGACSTPAALWPDQTLIPGISRLTRR